jgi:hypothetical protein
MRGLNVLLVAAVAGGCFVAAIPKAQAQVSVSVGVAPECPFGYYVEAPYGCAAAGYYGPEWFTGGVFVGAGPWFHSGADFRGNVNNTFHPAHGYAGPMPNRGERAEPAKRVDSAHFKGNEVRDGRGHTVEEKR